jgi:hypothetical protein
MFLLIRLHVVILSCYRYTLMLQCWSKTPDMRPSFAEIVSHLDSVMCRNRVYVDFTSLKPNYSFPPTEQQTDIPTNTKLSKWANTSLVMEWKYREIWDCKTAQQLKVGVSTSYLACLQVDFHDHSFKLCQFHDDLQSNQGYGIMDLKTAHEIKSAHPDLTSLARFSTNRIPGNTENGLHSSHHIYKWLIWHPNFNVIPSTEDHGI